MLGFSSRSGRTWTWPSGAGLLLAVLRGIEALGKGGSNPDSLRAIAETALALLPGP